jgi:hypothetical protein
MAFIKAVIDVLTKGGDSELTALVRRAVELNPSKRREERLCEIVLLAAQVGESGLEVAEYPFYQLKRQILPSETPVGQYSRYAVAALDLLKGADGPLTLPSLACQYKSEYSSVILCPEIWMFRALNHHLVDSVARTGDIRIRLKAQPVPVDSYYQVRTQHVEPIGPRIDEKSLELIFAHRPDLLEHGLTLVHRQYRVGVGIIDLLCVDKNGNYVVVELKRPSADYREVVGQIATYMGWMRRHHPERTVRG